MINGQRVGGKFLLKNKIGKGAYGEIYAGINMETNQAVAIKMESNENKRNTLAYEAKIYRVMQGGTGIPHIHWYGQEAGYNILVIDLLGASLEHLFKITRIEHFHNKSYLHRDIKPDNFVIGIGETSSTIYIIDYGLAKRYRDATTLAHISYRDHKKLTGTTRYASLNTHLGVEQSRRDDLECLAYTLIYLVKGELPWQGLPARNKAQKYQRIQEKKANIPLEELCKGLDIEFNKFLVYCRGLKFEERPDYNYLRKLFRGCFYRQKYDDGFEYDWVRFKIDAVAVRDKDWSSTGTNQAENDAANAENINRNILQLPQVDNSESPRWSASQQSANHSYISRQEGGLSPSKGFAAAMEQAHEVPEGSHATRAQQEMAINKEQSTAAIPEEFKKSLVTIDETLCNFNTEDIIEDHSIYEDKIPDEKPVNFHIFIPPSTYINNVRHWQKYRHRRVRNTIFHLCGAQTDFPLRNKTIKSVVLNRIQTHPNPAQENSQYTKKGTDTPYVFGKREGI